MPVSKDDVVLAFRLFLDREPENEKVVDEFRALDDVRALGSALANSLEFRSRIVGTPIGGYLDVPALDIEVDCSPADMQRMLDRIALNWRRFGDTEPHWSVLTQNDFRSDRIDATVDRFYASGLLDIDILLASLSRSGIDTSSFGRALDFGCGVGRLTLALAGRTGSIVGVDISGGHLEHARERARATEVVNADFQQISSIDDLDRYRDIDLVISLIVLQHNPPPVIAALLRKLLATLAPGGVAVIQVPTYIDGERFAVSEYLAGTSPDMEMNALPQDVVFRLIDEADCRPLEVRQDDAIGPVGLSHRFAITRRR